MANVSTPEMQTVYVWPLESELRLRKTTMRHDERVLMKFRIKLLKAYRFPMHGRSVKFRGTLNQGTTARSPACATSSNSFSRKSGDRSQDLKKGVVGLARLLVISCNNELIVFNCIDSPCWTQIPLRESQKSNSQVASLPTRLQHHSFIRRSGAIEKAHWQILTL